MNTSKYLLQPSTVKGWWVATDTESGVVVKFREGAYNESQQVTLLDDHTDPIQIAKWVNGIAAWLAAEYYDIAMPLPEKVRQRKRIGRELKQARLNAGFSLRELEELTGTRHQHISAIETGRYNVSIDILQRIASELGTEVKIMPL